MVRSIVKQGKQPCVVHTAEIEIYTPIKNRMAVAIYVFIYDEILNAKA
jgi:hypothetical protein